MTRPNSGTPVVLHICYRRAFRQSLATIETMLWVLAAVIGIRVAEIVALGHGPASTLTAVLLGAIAVALAGFAIKYHRARRNPDFGARIWLGATTAEDPSCPETSAPTEYRNPRDER